MLNNTLLLYARFESEEKMEKSMSFSRNSKDSFVSFMHSTFDKGEPTLRDPRYSGTPAYKSRCIFFEVSTPVGISHPSAALLTLPFEIEMLAAS